MRNSGLLRDSLPGCDTDVATHHRKRTRHVAAAAVVAALFAAPAAHADWKREYDRGSKAIVEQRWQEAEANFTAAMREDAEAKERKRFEGQRYQPYVPQYYAGLAAWRQGACDRALGYWQSPANQAVIGKLPELKARQDQGVADCQQKLAQAAKPTTPATTTTQPATTTTQPATTVAQQPTKPATTTSTTKPATTQPATQPAATTTTPVAQQPAATKPATATTAKPAPGTAAPAALVTAVDAWIAGRYANIVQLDPASAGDGARAQLLLLRAAARHTQAELAGGDAAQLEQARSDVRAAKAANAALKPDDALFPPRFRAFWQQTR